MKPLKKDIVLHVAMAYPFGELFLSVLHLQRNQYPNSQGPKWCLDLFQPWCFSSMVWGCHSVFPSLFQEAQDNQVCLLSRELHKHSIRAQNMVGLHRHSGHLPCGFTGESGERKDSCSSVREGTTETEEWSKTTLLLLGGVFFKKWSLGQHGFQHC